MFNKSTKLRLEALEKLRKRAEVAVGGILQIGVRAFTLSGGSSDCAAVTGLRCRHAVTEADVNAGQGYAGGLFLLSLEFFCHTTQTLSLITGMTGISGREPVRDGVLAGQMENDRAQGQECNEVGNGHEAVQDIGNGPDHSQITHGPDGNRDDP